MMEINDRERRTMTSSRSTLDLRVLLAGVMLLLFSGYLQADENTQVNAAADITVYKTPYCGCCTKWIEHLQQAGFDVDVKFVEQTNSIRSRLGIPDKLASCHTAVVAGYWVEGHVPADLIQKLIADRPEHIKGISAPGMPQGAPGMDIPNSAPYTIYSLDDNGQTAVYATRDGTGSD